MPADALPFKVFYSKVSRTLEDLRNRAQKSGKLDEFAEKLRDVHKGLEDEPLTFGDLQRIRGPVHVLRRLISPFNVGFAVHTMLHWVYVQDIAPYPEDAFD